MISFPPIAHRRALAIGAVILGATCGNAAWGAQPLGCLIEPDRVADVGSSVVGVIQNVTVERGDRVTAGQVIAVLRADVERAAVAVATIRAESQAAVQAAEVHARFARQQFERATELDRKNVISRQALDQAGSEADVAAKQLAEARERLAQSARELDLARAQLAERTIRSPIDGVVAERYLSSGERVEEKPVLRIAKIDPLHVEVVVPVELYGTIKAGSPVTVIPDLPRAEPARAKVVLVDRVVDAASNTFRVQLEMPNPDLSLPAGLRCKADLGTGTATADSDATASR